MQHQLIALLSATPTRTVAHLFALSMGGVDVDELAGVIRNAAVMTIGPAKGHGFEIDGTTLRQTCELLAAMPEGAKIRLKHPEINPLTGVPKDATGTMVGRLRNPRVEGNQLRGDVHFGAYASNVPGVGDVRTYLLRQAKDDPAAIGLSAVIHFERDPQPDGRMPARVFAVDAVDFAEDPAANPRGLLAAIQQTNSGVSPGIVPLTTGGPAMDLLQLLQSLGLDPGATTADQIDAFVNKLAAEQKAQVETAGWKPGWVPLAAKAPAAPGTPAAAAPLAAAPAAAAVTLSAVGAGVGVGVAMLEAQRVTQIRQLSSAFGLGDEFAGLHLGQATTPDAFVNAARAELARRYAPTGTGNVNVGQDNNIASLASGIGDALLLRAGRTIATPHERSREFRGLSLTETCRAYLSAVGVDTRGMDKEQVCKLVFNRGRLATLARAQLAHTPSDFANILQDTLGKTLREQYVETPVTWNLWSRRSTHGDFRTITRSALSNAPRPRRLKPTQEYPDKSLSDSKETFALAKFGEIITIAWETMINDDMDAFTRIPEIMGGAMKRLEDDVTYYVLLKNAAMSDTVALFHASHANLGTGGVIGTTTMGEARKQMRVQVGLKGESLNLTPNYLLAPPTQETLAEQFLNSSFDMSKSNGITYNAFAKGGRVPMELIVEPRLEAGVSIEIEDGTLDTVAGSSTAWFTAASNKQIDTVETCFLESSPAPTTEEEDAFRTDGRSYKVRHVVAAKAIDHRGLTKNPGA